MNWEKIFSRAMTIWIFLGATILTLFVGFHHCNCSCYWNPSFVEILIIPLAILFFFWTIGVLGLAFINCYFCR